MTIIDVLVAVAALSILLVAVFVTHLLIELRKTAQTLVQVLDGLNQDLKPLLQSLTSATTELRDLSVALKPQIEKTEQIITNIHDTSMRFKKAGEAAYNTVTPLLLGAAGMRAGLKAFFSALGKDHIR